MELIRHKIEDQERFRQKYLGKFKNEAKKD